ncbi:Preprotein translocase subunit [Nymphaea thermarum]|nr:Preprotein translocase subunit [Nymphaea thermarum]
MLVVLEESMAKSPVCACLKNGRALIDYFASNTTEASSLISATLALWSTASIGRTLFSSVIFCLIWLMAWKGREAAEGSGREGRLGKREEEGKGGGGRGRGRRKKGREEERKEVEPPTVLDKKEGSATGETLACVLEEIHMIEWLDFGKVLGTTGVVLSVIAGSSVVLLTVNAAFVELSNRFLPGKGSRTSSPLLPFLLLTPFPTSSSLPSLLPVPSPPSSSSSLPVSI